MRSAPRWVFVLCAWSVSLATLSADTLVMRDGRRIVGRLLGIREGLVEFEAQRGRLGRERLRVDQEEVARIEFDQLNRPGDSFDGNGLAGGPSGGRPYGMREREVVVLAEAGWRDSGIQVRAGQTVYFNASGRVRWGPGRQDGPAGERNSPRNDGRPIPSRPGAALIGRVGEGTDYFMIGAEQGPIRVRTDGRLYLGINDDFLADNSGSFRVTVYY